MFDYPGLKFMFFDEVGCVKVIFWPAPLPAEP